MCTGQIGVYVQKFITFLILIVFNLSSLAAYKVVGEVVKIRGKVTILAPGELQSRKLTVGQRVKEDSSILTDEKSFARLKLHDGSTLNIGPKSKMAIVHMEKSGSGVVSLLKGKMRSVIKKNTKGQKRFFIQTRTAAMAVRGTEFETIYNPENRVSSLLTYKGEVAIKKTDDLIVDETDKPKEIVRQGKKLMLRERPTIDPNNIKKLSEVFKDDKTVFVKGGQFSTTVKKYNVVSEAVKISPIQLNTLYKNDEYIEKKVSDVRPRNLESGKRKLALESKEQEAPIEGLNDEVNKKFAPRAGGLIDFESGLYVAPTKEAKLDKKLNVFVPDNIGYIDAKTGQYAPPVGLKLVPTKGFVIDRKNLIANNDIASIQRQEKILNDSLGGEVVLKTKEVPKKRNLKRREQFKKSILIARLSSLGQEINHDNDTFLNRSETLEDISSSGLGFTLRLASNSRYQVFTSFDSRSIDVKTTSTISFANLDDRLIDIEGGFSYSWKPRVDVFASFGFNQRAFLNHVSTGSSTSQEIKRLNLPEVRFGISGSFARSSNWSADYLASASFLFARDGGTLSSDSGFELQGELSYKYWFSRRYFLDTSFFVNHYSLTINGSSQTFTADVSSLITGFNLGIGAMF